MRDNEDDDDAEDDDEDDDDDDRSQRYLLIHITGYIAQWLERPGCLGRFELHKKQTLQLELGRLASWLSWTWSPILAVLCM